MDRQVGRRRDRNADRSMDGQVGRQKREIGRQTGPWTDR